MRWKANDKIFLWVLVPAFFVGAPPGHPVIDLGSFGGWEDNHCQEDGRVKSAWRETRVFVGFRLFVLFKLLPQMRYNPILI